MQGKGERIIGITLIFLGLLWLFARLINVSLWSFIWPLVLIGVGIWMIARHRHAGKGGRLSERFIGDIKREGSWDVNDEEFRLFIGDIVLDMTQANIPSGETRLQAYGFIGDVKLTLPKGVGISVSSSGFITDSKILGKKKDQFLSSAKVNSENFEKASKKIRLETTFFIHNLIVNQE